ncbi:anthranilate synthase component II-like [Hibiscus syriacus]|uniref:Anthranilate synthase component II-like n=1 Tax=Hibiscus syriacus TaxID=106335 RepID=A0A6A3CU74_HIBSY|nr:anthranilate synthase component II-like [Hibiscus syriacus]
MKGRGREMVQLGLPIADAPLDDEMAAWTCKGMLIKDGAGDGFVYNELIFEPNVTVLFFQGDHSSPRTWPPWVGNPTFILFLTECDITFGRVIGINHPGDFKASLKLSLAPGSLLMMEGKSLDFAKHALPSVRKQRVLVTFTKYQPKKSMADNQRPLSPSVCQSSQWGPPSSRLPTHFHHSAGPKHYAAIPTTGVLPAAGVRPQIPPPNVVQPLFVPAPVAPAIQFPSPVPISPGSTGWSAAAAQRHFAPHLPIPGTGVFLPPPGSNSRPQQLTIANVPVETTFSLGNDNGSGKPINHATSPREKGD